MSSGCGDVLSLEDLKTAKKHQIFEAEVITGLAGGVASGDSIDYATNQATGQVQKTMPAILRDVGFRPASFDFVSGGTIGMNDRDLAVLWPLPSGDGDWYYWEGALPKVVPASSSPATTGGVADGAWRPVGDITLRGELARHTPVSGGTLIGLSQGGNVQHALQYVTPQMFGAIGNYNPTTDTGADDTVAFRNAIAFSIANGYRKVLVPAGYNYLVTDEINLGGVGYRGTAGVALVGENWMNTNLYFRVPSPNAVCIAIRGGSGSSSGRYVEGLTIQPTSTTRYTGVGIQLAGACFTHNSSLWVRQFGINLHLLNDVGAGVFTEFNEFRACRIHRGITNILMEVNGGDNSFHGNDFINVKYQVKTTVDGGDGNVTPGVGFELRGTTAPAYWYNGFSQMHMFGGAGAVGIKLTNANTDNISGQITGEGSLILVSTDTSSRFEMFGGFRSIGPVTFSTPAEPTNNASIFVFDNRISNTSNFTSPSMTGLAPSQYPTSMADRTNNGGFSAIFRSTGSNTESLCYAAGADAASHHYFGYTPASGNLQGFVPGMRINHDGGALVSYSSTLYINSSGAGGVQVGTNLFAPRVDNTETNGTAAFRWSVVYSATGTINTSDIRFKKFRTESEDISTKERAAAVKIKSEISAYQFTDALEEKGGSARMHFGVGAQRVREILIDAGLNPDDYAFLTVDQWDDKYEDEVLIKSAGYRWGIRYDELTMFLLMNM